MSNNLIEVKDRDEHVAYINPSQIAVIQASSKNGDSWFVYTVGRAFAIELPTDEMKKLLNDDRSSSAVQQIGFHAPSTAKPAAQ